MPWPDTVICQFKIIPPNPNGNDFYRAYNKLLSNLFPSDTDFTVIPWHLEPCSSQSCAPMVFFEVVLGTKPVFILKPQAPADLTYRSSCQTADQEIRLCLGDLAEQCPILTLHTVSAMGMQANDTAPKERWDCDVLDANGEARLHAVVDAIKEACKNITNI
ncbi:hypothetical protein EV401DRAFT_2169715 [Pisolithus croceorrhizus]|nr:hypothetical protein EV401DRAFT_2169715 [Pisolithus croceorrhizus]